MLQGNNAFASTFSFQCLSKCVTTQQKVKLTSYASSIPFDQYTNYMVRLHGNCKCIDIFYTSWESLGIKILTICRRPCLPATKEESGIQGAGKF